MKKILTIITLLSILSSCGQYLDEDNKAGATNEKIYSTEAGYETLRTNVYSSLRKIYETRPFLLLAGTDLYQLPRGDQNPIYSYVGLNATNSDVLTFYMNCYTVLQGVNAAEYWLKVAPASVNKALYQAEYDFFKGFIHFLLIEQFGGIVINDEYTMSPRTQMPRATLADSYTYVIGKLTSALAGPLPQTDNTGKICKDIVNHYLAKTYLTRGWDLGNTNDFTLAKAAAQAVLTSRGESLTQTFANLWSASNENNNEILFAVQYDKSSLTSATTGNDQEGLFGPYLGGNERTNKYMSTQLYPSWSLHSWYDQYDARYEGTFMLTVWKEYYEYYTAPTPATTEVTAVYPRAFGTAAEEMYQDYLLLTEGLDENGLFKNMTMQDEAQADNVKPAAKEFIKKWCPEFQGVADASTIQPWGSGSPFTSYMRIYPFINLTSLSPRENETLWRSGYISDYCQPVIKKFDMTTMEVWNQRQSYRDIVLASLSETMFLYAEACIGLADYPGAQNMINKVSARPGNLKPGGVSLDITLPATKEGALEVYLKETGKELAGQYCGRWPELRRTKMLEYMYTTYNYDATNLTATQRAFMNLRPIPQNAIDLNESLSAADQNPGY